MYDLHTLEQNLLLPGIQQIATLSKLVVDHAEGVYLYDSQQRKILDFFAAVGCCSVGHAHPRYIDAVSRQLHRVTSGSFTTDVRYQYLQKLRSTLPDQLSRVQLFTTGAEAVEASIRLACAYTGKSEIVAFWGGYHGKTRATLSLTGQPVRQDFSPPIAGTYVAPYADCYRCPLEHSYPECELACVRFLDRFIQNSTSNNVAAILIEPIQGTNGNLKPPDRYLQAVAEIARRHQALLIFDETITGLGRTGRMFAFEHAGVIPDIMVLGKGIASGFPMSAIVAQERLCNSYPFTKPSGSSSSYGGNPLAAAAAKVTLEIILEEGLVENARAVGQDMLEQLHVMQMKYPVIGTVRGKGLMIGMELVVPGTKKPLPGQWTNQLFEMALEEGLLTMCYSSAVRINPPLCLTHLEARMGLSKLETALNYLSEQLK